jgi:hypothetical protein
MTDLGLSGIILQQLVLREKNLYMPQFNLKLTGFFENYISNQFREIA